MLRLFLQRLTEAEDISEPGLRLLCLMALDRFAQLDQNGIVGPLRVDYLTTQMQLTPEELDQIAAELVQTGMAIFDTRRWLYRIPLNTQRSATLRDGDGIDELLNPPAVSNPDRNSAETQPKLNTCEQSIITNAGRDQCQTGQTESGTDAAITGRGGMKIRKLSTESLPEVGDNSPSLSSIYNNNYNSLLRNVNLDTTRAAARAAGVTVHEMTATEARERLEGMIATGVIKHGDELFDDTDHDTEGDPPADQQEIKSGKGKSKQAEQDILSILNSWPEQLRKVWQVYVAAVHAKRVHRRARASIILTLIKGVHKVYSELGADAVQYGLAEALKGTAGVIENANYIRSCAISYLTKLRSKGIQVQLPEQDQEQARIAEKYDGRA